MGTYTITYSCNEDAFMDGEKLGERLAASAAAGMPPETGDRFDYIAGVIGGFLDALLGLSELSDDNKACLTKFAGSPLDDEEDTETVKDFTAVDLGQPS